jgi:PAS domain S-box-containing protein
MFDSVSQSDAPAAQLLLAAIVDSSEDAIISKNLQAIVTSWNAGAVRTFGYQPDEMIGQPITRLIPPDRLNEEEMILDRLKRGERVEHFESIRVRKDGTPIDVSLTISPVKDRSGLIIGASKIARDITEQKRALRRLAEANTQLEDALRQLREANKQLERAAQMKSEFVATLSHELRTPLTAIAGWVHLLKDPTVAPDELAEGLIVIERNLRVQMQLIEDLLDMSRIEAGKITLDVQSLDLATVVDAAIETVQPAATAKQIRITKAFSSLGGIAMGDRNRLQQIIWNLLTNALKFTPKAGRIHVTIERVNSHAEIAISDNGEGIAPEFLPQVFERFRQADSSTTRTHGGLGLGLSIVKHLTELHGGEVRARSGGVGKGATFILSMPLVAAHHDPSRSAAAERNASVDAAAAEADLRDIKVLSIDDDTDSATVIRRILQSHHAEVKSASSMDDGLRLAAEFKPDVILSDIGMPGHDGYEFIKRLRKGPNGCSIPAVALTALARSEDRTRALRAGFQMHVAKPVDPAELVAVVMNLANLRTKGERVR